MKFNNSLMVGAITLLALVGCSSSKNSDLPPSPASSPAEKATQPKAGSAMTDKMTASPAQGGFAALQGVVTKTKAAVKAGNFTTAKADFDQFEASWSKVEDGVKAKSRSGYDNIEAGMDGVKRALKESKSEAAIAALDSLNQSIVSVAKLT